MTVEGFTFKLIVDGMENGALPVSCSSPPGGATCSVWDVTPAITDGLYILSCSAHAGTFAEAVGHTVADLQAAGLSVRAVRWAPPQAAR